MKTARDKHVDVARTVAAAQTAVEAAVASGLQDSGCTSVGVRIPIVGNGETRRLGQPTVVKERK